LKYGGFHALADFPHDGLQLTLKVSQLVEVWINLSYRYFTRYSRDRTNCNALDLLLGKNTEDCFFFNLSYWTHDRAPTRFEQRYLVASARGFLAETGFFASGTTINVVGATDTAIY
jgi:hypothetical protein